MESGKATAKDEEWYFKPCPACGCEEVVPADVLKHHVNMFNVALFFLGGWILSVLWSVGRKEKVRCVQCGNVYTRKTPVSKLARMIFAVLVVLALLGLVMLLMGA